MTINLNLIILNHQLAFQKQFIRRTGINLINQWNYRKLHHSLVPLTTLRTFSGPYHSPHNLFQMNHRNKPIVIHLKRVPQGYVIDVPTKPVQPAPQPKIPKIPKEKNTSSKQSAQLARLARELSIGDIPSLSQQAAPASSKDIPESNLQQMNIPVEQVEQVQNTRESQLPKCPAKWFNLEKIDEIEKLKLPQFFNGKTYKTSELYLKWRNLIIKLYQANPTEYLTKIACRRVLRGDANAIMRVHSFLQNEGIINFGLCFQGMHTFKHNFINKNLQLKHLPESQIHNVPERNQESYKIDLYKDQLTCNMVNKPFSRTFRSSCCICKLISGIVWYVKKNDITTQVCFECWSKMTPHEQNQYEKTDSAQKMSITTNSNNNSIQNLPKRTNWNVQENIKMLEMISQPNKDWKTIVDQFQGRKGVQDIILQFMQFPIANYIPKSQDLAKIDKTQLKYPYNQYLSFLDSLYKKSVYSTKQQQQFPKPKLQTQETNSSKLVKSFLKSYDNLINKQLETQDKISEGFDFISSNMLRNKLELPIVPLKHDQEQQLNEEQYLQESEGRLLNLGGEQQQQLLERNEPPPQEILLNLRENDSCDMMLDLREDPYNNDLQ